MLFFQKPDEMAGIRVELDDERLIPVFGESYKQSDDIAELLDALIESEEKFTFRDAKDLRSYINKVYSDDKYLNLDHAPILPGTPVTIIMQGSRSADAKEADRKLAEKMGWKFPRDHDGYTWHHKEDIAMQGGRWKCNMYLVESGYHRRHPHKGGVYIYEMNTGIAYS